MTISACDVIFQIKAMGGFIKEQIIDWTTSICLLNMKKQKAIRIGKFTKQTLREADYLNMEIIYANI